MVCQTFCLLAGQQQGLVRRGKEHVSHIAHGHGLSGGCCAWVLASSMQALVNQMRSKDKSRSACDTGACALQCYTALRQPIAMSSIYSSSSGLQQSKAPRLGGTDTQGRHISTCKLGAHAAKCPAPREAAHMAGWGPAPQAEQGRRASLQTAACPASGQPGRGGREGHHVVQAKSRAANRRRSPHAARAGALPAALPKARRCAGACPAQRALPASVARREVPTCHTTGRRAPAASAVPRAAGRLGCGGVRSQAPRSFVLMHI